MATGFIRRLAVAGAVFLAALAPAVASAQSQRPFVYVFAAPGADYCCGNSESILHVGGGGEVVFPIGVGVGVELGFLGPWESFKDYGVGIASLNGSYHFGRPGSRVRPFVTGGWSFGFGEDYWFLWNFGGGVQYWFRDALALRFEFRDHVDYGHYWGVRIGLSVALGGW